MSYEEEMDMGDKRESYIEKSIRRGDGVYCSACHSDKWSTLTSCAACGNTVCDECPGASYTEFGMVCAKCAKEMDTEPECECRFSGDQADASMCAAHGGIPVLRPIVTKVRMPNIIEWEKVPEETKQTWAEYWGSK